MKTFYQCEICSKTYDTLVEAEACEAKPMIDMDKGNLMEDCRHMPEVGDMVTCSYPAFSWWNGHEDWRKYYDRGGRFVDGFYALWVVAAKIPDGQRHSWKYILWTPSNQHGQESLVYTSPYHHPMYPEGGKADICLQTHAEDAFEMVARKDRIPLL